MFTLETLKEKLEKAKEEGDIWNVALLDKMVECYEVAVQNTIALCIDEITE